MSYLTDVVFVTADERDARCFVETVIAYYPDLDVKPAENDGRANSTTTVFHLVLNYAQEMVAELQAEEWRSNCLLWTKLEADDPSVDHFGPPPPPPRRRQHYNADELGDLEQQAIAAGIIKPLEQK